MAKRPAEQHRWPAERKYHGACQIEAWEVGAEVGNVKNNRPELMERVELL
jgi:hypothetical protein